MSFILYIVSPSHYDYNYIIYTILIFFVSVILFFCYLKKYNYFDFDTIFITAYFFSSFVYPAFIYPINSHQYFMFNYDFNENVITQSTSMSLLAIISYFLGRMKVFKSNAEKNNIIYIPYNNIITAVSFVFFVLYMFLGGYDYITSDYLEQKYNPIILYLFLIYFVLILVAIVVEFNNKLYISCENRKYECNYFLICLVLSILFIYLQLGSRTAPLQLILIIIGAYSILFKPIGILKYTVFIIFGFILMYIVSLYRGEGDILYITNIFDLALDLIINNRNLFLAVDYVSNNGINYGETMLGSLMAPFPFLQSVISDLGGVSIERMSSSYFFTYLTVGEIDGFGVGTHIVADLYLSFGILGVVILMFYLGKMMAFVYANIWNNVYVLYTYAIMISYSIFIVRAEFFVFLRYLLWGYVIIYFMLQVYRFCKYKAIL